VTVKNSHADILERLQRIQQATREHRQAHGCGAYTFEDGYGLIDLVQSVRAMRVVELGTALGFTACCLAQGHESTHVDTVEADETHVRLARKNISDMGLAANITVHQGLFIDTLANLVPGYDVAFFDGFAPSIAVLDQVKDLLRNNGLLICANTSLADSEERQKLDRYFNNTDFWLMKTPIEHGQTRVCVKR